MKGWVVVTCVGVFWVEKVIPRTSATLHIHIYTEGYGPPWRFSSLVVETVAEEKAGKLRVNLTSPFPSLRLKHCPHPKMLGRKTPSVFKPAPLHPNSPSVSPPEVKGWLT